MSNKVNYFYCASCGYEDFDILVSYSRQTADDDYYICPLCNSESSNVKTDDFEGDE